MLAAKYTNFYESVSAFLIESNLVEKNSIVGASMPEIAKIENLIEQTFPHAFKIFLRYSGKSQLPIYPEFAMTLPYIERAYKSTSLSTIKKFLGERNYIIGSDGVKIMNGEVVYIDFVEGQYVEEEIVNLKGLVNPEKIIFLNSDSTTKFISAEEENPIVHFFLTDYSFTSSRLRLTDYIRSIIFNRINRKFQKRDYSIYDKVKDTVMYEFGLEVNKIKLYNREWSETYYKLFQNKVIPFYKVIEEREKFYRINKKTEENKEYILTIDEFEWAFIDYLRGRGYEC